MKKLILAFLLLWACSAYAQFDGCQPGFCKGLGFGPGFSNRVGGGIAPVGCAGVIDMSKGCALPMFGS